MKNVLSLTHVMLKSSLDFGLNSQKKRSRWQKILIGCGVIALIAYLTGLMTTLFKEMLLQLVAINQTGLAIALIFILVSGYLLLAGILMAPPVLYFSKDISRFLVMPLKSWQLVTAKFITLYVSALLSSCVFLIPFLMSYSLTVGFSLSFIFLFVLAGMVLPLVPIVLSATIMVLLFTFIPFIKNKELFTYFSTFLVLALSLGFTFFSFWLAATAENPQDLLLQELLQSLQANPNSLVHSLQFLPTLNLLIEAVVFTDISKLLLATGFSLLVFTGAILLIQKPYLQGIVHIDEQSSSKKLTTQTFKQKSRPNSPSLAIIKYDLKHILRSPTLTLEYILGPIIIGITTSITLVLFLGLDGETLHQIQSFMMNLFNFLPTLDTILYTALISLIISFAFAMFSSISSTALSREGSSLAVLQTLPVSLLKIINCKIILGALVMVLPSLVIGLLLTYVLAISPLYFIIYALVACFTSLITSLLDITFDIIKPKLNWENEQQVTKNNFITVAAMLATTILITVGVGLFFLIPNLTLYSVTLFTGLILLTILLYALIQKLSLTRLPQAIENIE